MSQLLVARRRSKQRVFETVSRQGGDGGLPVSDLTIEKNLFEEMVAFERDFRSIVKDAKGITNSYSSFVTTFEGVIEGEGDEVENASELNRELESSLHDGDDNILDVLDRFIVDIVSDVNEFRKKYKELDDVRLDFDAYRRKVAKSDKKILEAISDDTPSAESDKLYEEQRDKQRKLATATEKFDMNRKSFVNDISNKLAILRKQGHEHVMSFLTKQQSYVSTVIKNAEEASVTKPNTLTDDAYQTNNKEMDDTNIPVSSLHLSDDRGNVIQEKSELSRQPSATQNEISQSTLEWGQETINVSPPVIGWEDSENKSNGNPFLQ